MSSRPYPKQKVLSASGPLARDVDSLALCMQALLCDYMFTLDPTVPPIPFNTQVGPLKDQQNLRFQNKLQYVTHCMVLRRSSEGGGVDLITTLIMSCFFHAWRMDLHLNNTLKFH